MQRGSDKDKSAHGSFEDQLKEYFGAREDKSGNKVEEQINKDLEKEFEKWLDLDKGRESEAPVLGRALKQGKRKFSSESEKPKKEIPPEQKAGSMISGMDTQRLYAQLTLKQKKELAWLLREEGLV